MTTSMPAVSSRFAETSSRTPSCIQTIFGSGSSASTSSTMPGTAFEARKMSTMSIGSGMSASFA